MTPAERNEFQMQARQTAIRFQAVCAQAVVAIEAFIAAWHGDDDR